MKVRGASRRERAPWDRLSRATDLLTEAFRQLSAVVIEFRIPAVNNEGDTHAGH